MSTANLTSLGRAAAAPNAAEQTSGDDSTALAEGFARRIGVLSERLRAAPANVRWARRAAFAVSRATTEGHVCVSLATLTQRYGEDARAARAALLASGVACEGDKDASDDESDSDGIAAQDLLPLVIDRAGRIYLARYFDYERRLAEALVARARPLAGGAPDAAALAERVARYFAPQKDAGIDWQRVAALVALSGRLTVVSGGPGTGKTTTVVGVLACLLDTDPDLRIALAAPTGKAAQRMQEALIERASDLPAALAARLPRTSFTLQRLLGTLATGGFRHHRDNPLPYDVIVVDEASMIDVALAAHLLEALGAEARLVMLGDKDQLAAVEAGAVFAELSARPEFGAEAVARIAGALSVTPAEFVAALPHASAQPEVARADADAYGADYLLDKHDDKHDDEDGYAALHAVAPEPWQPLAEVDATTPGALTDCVVWLERNYRFGLDSAIGRLSTAIRRGEANAALAVLEPARGEGAGSAGSAAAVLIDDTAPNLSPRTIARLGAGFAPYSETLAAVLNGGAEQTGDGNTNPDAAVALFDALNRFRVLCATRRGARGVEELNARMSALVRERAGVTLALGAQWFAGRPVIVTRNDYALGLFNGDIGIALPAADGALRVAFRLADGTLRQVSPAALPPHETAFALTVHKSQGSEFDHAALVLPHAFSRVLSRELVYTAVTRAKRRIDVIGAASVFAEALANPTRRDSGLAARIAAGVADSLAGSFADSFAGSFAASDLTRTERSS